MTIRACDLLHPATVNLLRTLAEHPASSGETAVARRLWIEANRPDLPPTAQAPRFGELLVRKRTEVEWSQRDLADALVGIRGMSRATIVRIEHGEHLPDAGQLAAIFTVLPWTAEEKEDALRRALDDRLVATPVAERAA